MRPTLRAAFLFIAGVPVSLALVLVDGGFWPYGLAVLGFSILITGIDAVFGLPARALDVTWNLPDVLYIGDEDPMTLTLHVRRRRSRAMVEIACDVGVVLETPPRLRIAIGSDEATSVALPLRPTRRGTATVRRLWLRWTGPLGLFQRQRTLDLEASVPVIPNLRAVRQAALHFSAWDALHGTKLQTQQGEGSEFNALREYVPGLDHRSIDWKQSARHRKLVCKEFEVERNHNIVMAFDTGHLMSEPLEGIPKLDHAINAGLLMGWASIQGGDRIGVFGFDSSVRHFSRPLGGRHGFARLQHASAELDYRYEETNFTLGLGDLLGRLDRRSLVVVLSDFVDTVTAEMMVGNLQRLASRHLVVFVTLRDVLLDAIAERRPDTVQDMLHAVIADDLGHERRVVFQRLRRLGVQCLETPSAQLAGALLNKYLDIKRNELI